MRVAGFARLELTLCLGLLVALAAVTGPRWYLAREDAQLHELELRLTVVREAIERYRADHGDRVPGSLAGTSSAQLFLDQLTRPTDAEGVPQPHGKFGPYLPVGLPVNPFNERGDVQIATDSVLPDPDDQTGWCFHTPSATFRANSVGTAGRDREPLASM